MKSVISLAICTVVALGCHAQAITEFRASAPMSVTLPVMTDSVNPHGKKFETSSLLDNRTGLSKGQRPMHAAEADTAGWLYLPGNAEGFELVVVQASLRPEHYAKGSLEIESTMPLRAYLNGTQMASKDSRQDSIDGQSKVTMPLEMLPQTTNVVDIKILTDTLNVPLRVKYVAADDFADVPVAFVTDGKRRYELRDMYLGARVQGTSISPDGKYMVLHYSERFSKDNTRNWSTLTDLSTGKVVNSNLPAGVRWMPKGSKLYRTAKSGDGYDVFTIAVPSMAEELIMENIPDKNFDWSPAEDYIVYYDMDEGEPNAGPLRHYRHPDDRLAGNRTRMFLKKYDPATGQTQTLLYGSRPSAMEDISADGKRMLIGVADYDVTEWPMYFNSLYELDLATMKMDTIVTRDGDIQSAIYSPDGRSLWIMASAGAFDGIGLNCGEHPIYNTSDFQGYILDLDTRKARAMTRDFDPSLHSIGKWNAADNKIYFMAEAGFGNTIYQLDPATGNIKALPQDISYIQAFSIGNDESQWLSYNGQSKDSSGRAYLYNLKNGKLKLVADPWAEVADQIDWGTSEQWNFTASDGTEIEGYLTFPPDFDPAKKYPLVVYYYGGTAPTKHNSYSPYNPQVFTSRGYIVYQLNPSGTTGYGQEFSARHVNAWGDYTASDIIEGTKKLLAERPYIDADKVGAIGASYGGFMTQYLMALTDIFAAGVAHAGISNVASYWGVGDWGYSYNALAAAKSYPWNNPDLYTKHGSLFNADKIHTPLLLIHGASDNNVPPGESIQLFNALKILGRPVELITVDGEDHYISNYDNRIAWQNSIMAYFAKYLQDDPRWWKALYGE